MPSEDERELMLLPFSALLLGVASCFFFVLASQSKALKVKEDHSTRSSSPSSSSAERDHLEPPRAGLSSRKKAKTREKKATLHDRSTSASSLPIFSEIIWKSTKCCVYYVLSTGLTMISLVMIVAAWRSPPLTRFFEEHGLTVILSCQVVLYLLLAALCHPSIKNLLKW